MTDQELNRLAAAAAVEMHCGPGRDFKTSIEFTLREALDLIANLQLAGRHPGNNGTAAATARCLLMILTERIERAGCTATLELIKLGEDPSHDVDAGKPGGMLQ